jgi:hypothetical protein
MLGAVLNIVRRAYVIILRKRESLLCVLYISMLIMKQKNDHMHELEKTISNPIQ